MAAIHYLDEHSQILTDEWQHRLICLVLCQKRGEGPGKCHKEMELGHDKRVVPRHSKTVIG